MRATIVKRAYGSGPVASVRCRAGLTVLLDLPPAQAADLIDHLRAAGVSIIYDPATRALRTDTKDAVAVTVS